MRKKDSKGSNKNNFEFSRGLCAFFLGVCRLVSIFLGARIKKSKSFKQQKKKGPMLVVANHLSAIDFIFFSSAFVGTQLNFVVAQNMLYSTPFFAKLIKKYNAITKKQFYADFQCIKNIKKCLDSGVSVLICPEGKVAADGRTGAILPSIVRLIGWLGYPVGSIKLRGASLLRPKWAGNLRLGRVEVECDMIFDENEAKTFSKEEIWQGVCNALEHNEHEWQLATGHKYLSANYAVGLNRLLYRCPKCAKENCMSTKKSEIVCKSCGNRIEYKRNGELVAHGDSVAPDRIDLWYQQQKEIVANEVKSDDFTLENAVHLFVENEDKKGYRYACEGKLILTKDKLVFDSVQTQRPKRVTSKYGVNAMQFEFFYDEGVADVEEEFLHVEFAINNTDTVANMPGTSIDMYDEKHIYRFMFEEGISSTKYVLAIEEIFKQNAQSAT